jgi:hypothetical protein
MEDKPPIRVRFLDEDIGSRVVDCIYDEATGHYAPVDPLPASVDRHSGHTVAVWEGGRWAPASPERRAKPWTGSARVR